MTVTTSCYLCLAVIAVPLALFDQHQIATCRDAGTYCTRPPVIR